MIKTKHHHLNKSIKKNYTYYLNLQLLIMEPFKIDVKGPFHINHLNTIKENNSLQNNPAGIYIWGFVYSCDENGLADPLQYQNENEIIQKLDNNCDGIKLPENNKFVPYYVGIDSKLNYLNRIQSHHKITKGNSRKYIRFSESFMRSYSIGKNKFPISYCNNKGSNGYNDNIFEYIKKNKNTVDYINEPRIIAEIYEHCKLNLSGMKNHWPINEQLVNENKIEDVLEKLVEKYDNFWFCYIPINCDSFIEYLKKEHKRTLKNQDSKYILELFETIIFWSLKGLTISTIRNEIDITLSNDLDKIIKIQTNSCNEDIFKNLSDLRFIPLKGPSHSSSILFPGY